MINKKINNKIFKTLIWNKNINDIKDLISRDYSNDAWSLCI